MLLDMKDVIDEIPWLELRRREQNKKKNSILHKKKKKKKNPTKKKAKSSPTTHTHHNKFSSPSPLLPPSTPHKPIFRTPMQKAQKSQRKAQPKAAKKVTKTAKRNVSTTQRRKAAPKAIKYAQAPLQQMTFATAPQQKFPLSISTPLAAKKSTPMLAPLLPFPAFKQQKRNMSVLIGTRVKGLVPCDPRFVDDEVISIFNPKTNMVEPVIVTVPEQSFEFLFSSPCDLHTFDVLPVVKDCIDPTNPVFESMDA